jgi:hypothetical protein
VSGAISRGNDRKATCGGTTVAIRAGDDSRRDQVEEFLRNSLGRPEVPASIVIEEARVMSMHVARMEPAGRPALSESTRRWWLAGLAFVVLLAILTIWAWVTRPSTDRLSALSVAASSHTH